MSLSDHPRPRRGQPPPALLAALARRVRRRREDRSWTRGELAQRSGLSVRFLARIECGEGNISVLRLEALARALDTTPDELVRLQDPDARLVALVGLRGAGKSTVGPLLARRLAVEFIEMDTLIMEASGLPLDQIFELHGEPYYRRLELETLRRILGSRRQAVVAAAGGVVYEPATWDLLRERTTVVWLRARPEDHWNRVIAQGDRRPMAHNPDALQELRAMLAAREEAYSRAHRVVETSGRDPGEVAASIERQLGRSGYPVSE